MNELEFKSIRNDWYVGNSVLPRALRRCIVGERSLLFGGFPRQWIPVFEFYGVAWRNSVPPISHIPIFSDMDEKSICEIVERAAEQAMLRPLVEAASMMDPIVADCIYIVDNTTPLDERFVSKDLASFDHPRSKKLFLNGWQAYGRPAVRLLEKMVLDVEPCQTTALVLPCSLRRPYSESRTHRKIYDHLGQKGYDLAKVHKVVITSLGVIPEELWSAPQVLAYNAGVPDIYRLLRLARAWFSKARYERVVDCLQFKPYTDVLSILERERIIPELERVSIPGQRHFFLK